MKKVMIMLALTLGITLTTSAQRGKKENFEKMTVEQKTTLAVKKMTLKLDLTPNQVQQVKPLLLQKIQDRKLMHEKRKAIKKSDKKLSANEQYKIANERLDKQIAFKASMKRILNEKQYEKFEKMAKRKMKKMKKNKRGKKDRKRNR